jgi:hypothetical protein
VEAINYYFGMLKKEAKKQGVPLRQKIKNGQHGTLHLGGRSKASLSLKWMEQISMLLTDLSQIMDKNT